MKLVIFFLLVILVFGQQPSRLEGFTRQYTEFNGTAYSASGKYFITTEEAFFIRLDARQCTNSTDEKKEYPRICFCYLTNDPNVVDPECGDDEKSFVHVCQNDQPSSKSGIQGSYYGTNKMKNILGNYSSYEFKFTYETRTMPIGVEAVGLNCDYSCPGLQMVYDPTYGYLPSNKSFVDILNPIKNLKMYPPKAKLYYLRGKSNKTVYGIELFFKDDCARIDFYGLAYAGDLLVESEEEARIVLYKVPYKVNTNNKDYQPKGTRTSMKNEVARPTTVDTDECTATCCQKRSKFNRF